MAGYPGMKPMLQFTNLPPPPRERRRRRRKVVRTPEEPRVRSIPLARGAEGDDQENLPRPCLKWVSPQFCDELTENGTHLKDHNPRRRKTNKTRQPVQEVKELFPNESNSDTQQCPKSSTRRNPLRFRQIPDQCHEQGAHELHPRSAGWCSQEISMYPSTCVPRSKLKSQNKDESSDDSLTDGESDHHVRCNEGLDDRGCPSLSDDRNLQPDAGAYCGGADDHTVPSASQQVDNIMEDDDNFAGIRLRLSATTRYTGVSNPTQNKHREKEDNVCALAKDHRELIPIHNSHSNSLGTGMHTPQSTRQQDGSSIYPIAVGESATNAEGMHKNGGHISYPSMENLSELIKDMSVGDDIIATVDHSSPAHDQNRSKCKHSVHLENHEGKHPALPPSCTSTSSSCDRKLNKLEVTTFNPHSASTPFRDQLLQNADQSCDSDPCELSTATCMIRVAITPGHLEEQEVSVLVKETPEHLWCSPNLPNVENREAECDSEQSYRVSESIFQSAGLKSFSNDSNRTKLPPRQASCELSDIDMTTFNNFDNTDTSRTTMGHSCSNSTSCVHVTFMDPTLPPTQDSSRSNEGEWSILAKQTPIELWSSPVVKIVDDSLNST